MEIVLVVKVIVNSNIVSSTEIKFSAMVSSLKSSDAAAADFLSRHVLFADDRSCVHVHKTRDNKHERIPEQHAFIGRVFLSSGGSNVRNVMRMIRA